MMISTPPRALVLAAALCAALAASDAAAQRRGAPPPAPPAAPPPDPNAWWSREEPRLEARFDPLGGRRWNARDARARAGFSNGVDATYYRLWGLQPLQSLVLRRRETVYEVWYRPTDSVRQAVVRTILRSDGRAFVQARAGRGCCAPEITRRVDINQELPDDRRQALLRLRDDALWNQPRHVVVSEADDAVTAVCVDGASYDMTLVDTRRAVHLRRSCDPAELGSVAPALQAIVGAALGYDPRFDVVFTRERFDRHAQAYQALVAGGGRIRPSAEERQLPPPPQPFAEDEPENAPQPAAPAPAVAPQTAPQTTPQTTPQPTSPRAPG